MHCTFWFYLSILLTVRSTTPTKENSLPSPKIIHPSLLSSLDSCNIAFVALQAHCRQVTHCFRNVNPWWSIILILSGDISLNPGLSARNIKACHLNVRSLPNKTSAFSDFVLSNDLDIVGVTETWLRPSDTQGLMDEITPAGFQLHQVPRENKKGGGVAVLVRNDIDSVRYQIDRRETFEHITVKLSDRQSSQLLVHVIYRPPSTSKSRFIEEFNSFMEAAALSPHENIILGDVNIQLDSQNCWTENFNTVLLDFDFIQHVSTPTHIQGHILDVLCTSKSLTSSVHHHVKDGISDHLAVFFTTTFPVKNSCRVKRLKIRKLRTINKTEFMFDIVNSELIQAPYKTASLLSHQYFHTLRNILDKHAPVHECKTPQHVNKGFINSEILAAKRRKRKLEREWRKDNSAINRSRYRAAVNHFNRLVECAKTKHYSDMVRENEDNTRHNSIKKVLHRSPKMVLPDYTTMNSLVNTFGRYFADKITKLRSGLLSTDADPPVSGSYKNKFVSFRTMSEEEVLKIIKSTSNKSCDLDPIPTSLALECISVLLTPITNIVNYSLQEGSFPSCFKTAHVTPLLKKAGLDKNILKNYRPVSNLSYISKLIEKAVAKQINEHIAHEGISNENQSAYRAFHSTETALLKIQNDIATSMDKGAAVGLVLLDLSAAFDTIDLFIYLGFNVA